MTRKCRQLSMTLMLLLAMVLVSIIAPAMADQIVLCPPHAGAFPSQPVIQDTVKNKIEQIHNDQTLAVAKRACLRCGNGLVEPGEQCDTGGQSATCDADCTRPQCGDGVVNTAAHETCDDGNTVSGDGCSSTCVTEVPLICGNGVLQAGEQCDDGNVNNNDFCTNTCKFATCGDGIQNTASGSFERCDTGGQTATCNANCTLPVCGDAILNTAAGEQCDPPAPGICDASCKLVQQQQCNPPLVNCMGACVDTNTSVNNCGFCGNICSFPNSVGACMSGGCAIGGCSSGFQDCDANIGNGCEINTASDFNNCGMCGHACASGQSCTSGQCQ
jgi:cysteine-rich repeat protein